MKFESEWSVPETSVHNGASIIAFSPESFRRMSPATPANGRNKFVVNFASDNARGDAPGHLSFYVYHPEQAHNFGDYFYPSGEVQPESGRSGAESFGKHFVKRRDFSPERGRWYCYEYMVKANTPGHRDGRVAAWIDGKLIADFPNLRLRDVADLKINHIGLRMNIEENTLRANRKWHDNVVVATSYIGPIAERKKN